jgi:hypothetical protein
MSNADIMQSELDSLDEDGLMLNLYHQLKYYFVGAPAYRYEQAYKENIIKLVSKLSNVYFKDRFGIEPE